MFLFDMIEDFLTMVFAIGPRNKTLPVAIETQLLHIGLQIGPTYDTRNCPTISSVVDTTAALTTGNLFFISKIAKTFLQLYTRPKSTLPSHPLALLEVTWKVPRLHLSCTCHTSPAMVPL